MKWRHTDPYPSGDRPVDISLLYNVVFWEPHSKGRVSALGVSTQTLFGKAEILHAYNGAHFHSKAALSLLW